MCRGNWVFLTFYYIRSQVNHSREHLIIKILMKNHPFFDGKGFFPLKSTENHMFKKGTFGTYGFNEFWIFQRNWVPSTLNSIRAQIIIEGNMFLSNFRVEPSHFNFHRNLPLVAQPKMVKARKYKCVARRSRYRANFRQCKYGFK
jgi:hypothetical protein